jgi:hypothetical protein
MRRAPLVIAGTVAGLVGVLVFHTKPASLKLSTLGGTATTPGSAASATPGGTSQAGSGSAAGASPQPSSGRQPSAGKRTAVGPGVNYNYGVMSVKVTVSGNKILSVGIASINEGGDQRSISIDQQAIPLLEQEVMQAQSANIQGVSGASFTSTGFDQSLQSALQSLGLK